MLVAKRLLMKAHETPPAAMQKIFDRGNRHETACVATMQAEGWRVTDQQRELVLPIDDGVEVMGHLDGNVSHLVESPSERVLEAKSPNAWRMFIEEMYLDEPSPLVQRYKWQISCYMVAVGTEALMVTLDEQFNIRMHGIEMPFYNLADIKARVNLVEELAAQGYAGLPQFCQPREYPCQYFHLHEDEQSAFDIDTELDIAVDRYDRARTANEETKAKLKHEKEVLYEVMGTRTKVQTDNSVVSFYTRKSTSYDIDAMRLDGINVEQYKKVSESQPIPRVTKKGKSTDGD